MRSKHSLTFNLILLLSHLELFPKAIKDINIENMVFAGQLWNYIDEYEKRIIDAK